MNHVHLACSYSETSLGLDRGPHIYVTPQHDLLLIQIRVDKLCSVGVLQTSKERFDLLHDGPSKCNTRTICCTSQPILWCMAVAPLAQGHRGTVAPLADLSPSQFIAFQATFLPGGGGHSCNASDWGMQSTFISSHSSCVPF